MVAVKRFAGGFDGMRWLTAGIAVSAVAGLALLSAPGAKADSLISDYVGGLPTFQVDGQLNDWGVNVKNGDVNYNGATTYPCGTTGSGCPSTIGISNPSPPLYNSGQYANPPAGQPGGQSNGITLTPTNEIVTTTTHPQIVGASNGALNPYVEDSRDSASGTGSSGYVGPEAGGQNYDAEFLGAAVKQSNTAPGLAGATLSLGILSGLRPDNGPTEFGPGDIFITTRNADGSVKSTYGIEVGGGVGCATTNCNQQKGDQGSTYGVNSQGYTDASGNPGAGNGAQTQDNSSTKIGDVFKITSSSQVVNTPSYLGAGNGYAVELNGANLTDADGTTGYIGTVNSMMANWSASMCAQATGGPDQSCSDHSIIEAALNLGLFAGDAYTVGDEQFLSMSIYWGPDCGNDVVATDFTIGWQEPVPEPGTMAIFLTGLIGLGGMGWARRRKAGPAQAVAA